QGLLMKSGDFIESDIQGAGGQGGGGMAQMSSIALGQVNYFSDTVRAIIANPVLELPSDYEIRLNDGSIIRAKSFGLANGQLTIQEISGIAIMVDPSEIAQLRAGLTRVQPLITLPWKILGVPTAKAAGETKPPAAPPSQTAASTNEPPAVPPPAAAKPAAVVAADLPNPNVMTWAGPNQEQILVIPAGTSIEFPLKGKFRELAMRLAVAPGASPNAQATLRVLVNGKEVARTPEFTAGEQPRSMHLTVTDPKSVTLAVDSAQAGTRLLLIDPVAVRALASASPPARY
ncbi:MAG: NPCBM/NEW2 domain-containing protein, partial [Methylacidiphilales bacterium]|nr:NPCBM/NEW2 domain-containing protein [Candidatus Methylacidiphilales bacterium]